MNLITDSEWGKVVVQNGDNEPQVFKDVIVSPHMAEPWDWGYTDMHHKPGIGRKEVILACIGLHGTDIEFEYVVLSRGRHCVLHIQPEVLEFGHLVVIVAETSKAIEIYNDLAKAGKEVVALIHSTC